MKKLTLLSILLATITGTITAQTEDTIDISGNNTSSSYVSYNKTISLPASKTVNVKMARYCYFSSTISGSGQLNLYPGGERSYLGTEKGAAWPNWTNYKGDIHIYPFKENAPSAGFYGVVLAHGGKSFSPENVEDAVKSGKVNTSMQNNRVTLHSGATICCEANSAGAGFRIGELQTEAGSSIIGYMKKNTRAAYFLLGSLNTDATLAGTIAPPDYSDTHPLGIIKEGRGTYRITGNQNYLTGALRVMEGRVLVNNDRSEALVRKMRGGLGAKTNENEAIAYVFTKGVLGGTGSIGGSVDLYGTIDPGDVEAGTLTIRNYATPTKNAHLTVHPASVLRFRLDNGIGRLDIGGTLKYSQATEDFATSDAQPVVMLEVPDGFEANVGIELTLLTAKAKSGDWQFRFQQPGKGTWVLEEQNDADGYKLVARLTSMEDANPDDSDDPDATVPIGSPMGPYYDDGIADNTDTHTLRYYADKSGKNIGVAISSWKGNMDEGGKQFNMLVAENEMKMETLQPQQGQFSFGSADGLVSFAQRNKMAMRGHCLVWHQQQPEWLSSDGKKNDKGWTRKEALAIMKNHITNVMQHFKGKVTEWDVVNECLDDDQSIIRTNPDAYTLRQNVWQRAIGDDYIDSAFVYARQADPTALLYLNDYDVEMQGKAKAVAFYNIVKRLQQHGIPIDGVGLQCHFSVGDVDSVKLERTIRRFGDDGLKCIITELDMGVGSTSAKDLEEQARNYRVVTDIMLNNDNCPNMLIWGIKDNDSWRSGSNPLLYTAQLGRKPAWYAVRSALRHRSIVTDVEPVQATVAPSDAIYDLKGRRIGSGRLQPGIYVKGGKKILVHY
ncbi:MAG: endo-1,4-beta-xylanase [Prevotella sp.]|nr:endo-1,4-beta-xylanase [Prevotella sp.]